MSYTAEVSIEITNTVGAWIVLWDNDNSGIYDDISGVQAQYEITQYVNGNGNLQVRFIMGSAGSSSSTFTGWNIDDVRIGRIATLAPTITTYSPTTLSPTLSPRVSSFSQLRSIVIVYFLKKLVLRSHLYSHSSIMRTHRYSGLMILKTGLKVGLGYILTRIGKGAVVIR